MKTQMLAAMVLGVMCCAGARGQDVKIDLAAQYNRYVEFNNRQNNNAHLVMVASAAPAEDVQRMMAAGAPQVKDDLFAGTEKFSKDAKDVTELNLDPSMLGMVGGSSAEAAKKMDFIVIHSYGYDKPGAYSMDDVDAYRKKLTDGSWNCFLHVTDAKSGEKTDMCIRQGADNQTNELVILAAEPKELTFIHMKGRMSLNEMQRMSASTRMSARMAQHGGGGSFVPFYFSPGEERVPRTAVTITHPSTFATPAAPIPPMPPTPPAVPAR